MKMPSQSWWRRGEILFQGTNGFMAFHAWGNGVSLAWSFFFELSETALGRKKWYPYLRESASRSLSLHSFISRFSKKGGPWESNCSKYEEREKYGGMNILYMGQRYFSFSFFFCLVFHAMVFFSNIGLGGLYSKLAALEPFPVFLFSSLFIFYHFCFFSFFFFFLSVFLLTFYEFPDFLACPVVILLPWFSWMIVCLTWWSTMKLSALYSESRLFVFVSFFFLLFFI